MRSEEALIREMEVLREDVSDFLEMLRTATSRAGKDACQDMAELYAEIYQETLHELLETVGLIP